MHLTSKWFPKHQTGMLLDTENLVKISTKQHQRHRLDSCIRHPVRRPLPYPERRTPSTQKFLSHLLRKMKYFLLMRRCSRSARVTLCLLCSSSKRRWRWRKA